jgi:hypothetical protein
MTCEIFGPAWADAMRAALAASEPYRQAAAKWEGDLVLALTRLQSRYQRIESARGRSVAEVAGDEIEE